MVASDGSLAITDVLDTLRRALAFGVIGDDDADDGDNNGGRCVATDGSNGTTVRIASCVLTLMGACQSMGICRSAPPSKSSDLLDLRQPLGSCLIVLDLWDAALGCLARAYSSYDDDRVGTNDHSGADVCGKGSFVGDLFAHGSFRDHGAVVEIAEAVVAAASCCLSPSQEYQEAAVALEAALRGDAFLTARRGIVDAARRDVAHLDGLTDSAVAQQDEQLLEALYSCAARYVGHLLQPLGFPVSALGLQSFAVAARVSGFGSQDVGGCLLVARLGPPDPARMGRRVAQDRRLRFGKGLRRHRVGSCCRHGAELVFHRPVYWRFRRWHLVGIAPCQVTRWAPRPLFASRATRHQTVRCWPSFPRSSLMTLCPVIGRTSPRSTRRLLGRRSSMLAPRRGLRWPCTSGTRRTTCDRRRCSWNTRRSSSSSMTSTATLCQRN
eukprot:TRINITY_DN25879_c0_g1_i2.p1 TRINITY_DN25879_c0_g1~~TRINITY_DN25879_c0_g1_i2.p1  ORF type:complete len:449 (+),score=37.99 TRINITY_DN25879_c0_g1_i2:33-1349(+)